MVSLVKTKLGRAKAGDKKSWKGWLKSAAKQLLYHGCDRAWITAHVFQLENTRKESAEFDPMAGQRDIRLTDGSSSVVSHRFEVSRNGDSKEVVIDPSLESHVGQAPSVVGPTSTEPRATSDVVIDLSEGAGLISSPSWVRRSPRFNSPQAVAQEVVIDPSKAPIGLTNLLAVAADGVTDLSVVQSPVRGVSGGVTDPPENQTGPSPVPVVGKVINLPKQKTTRQSATTGRDADGVIDPSVSLPSHLQDDVVEILVTAEEAALLLSPERMEVDADPTPIIPNVSPTFVAVTISPRRSPRLIEKTRGPKGP